MEPKTPYVALKDDKASSRSDAAKLLRDLDETHNRASSLKLTALALALAAALALIGYRAATPAARRPTLSTFFLWCAAVASRVPGCLWLCAVTAASTTAALSMTDFPTTGVPRPDDRCPDDRL